MDKTKPLTQLETPFRLKPIKPSAVMEMFCVLSNAVATSHMWPLIKMWRMCLKN